LLHVEVEKSVEKGAGNKGDPRVGHNIAGGGHQIGFLAFKEKVEEDIQETP
jgi:hypothetical protein